LEPFFVVAGVILAAGTYAAYYAVRGTTWVVMTDELQTTKLASSIAETGSLVPRIHGRYYAALSQLYPLLITPFYGLMTPPDAATSAHALNAFLLASAAWPAYLLARSATGSRPAGYIAAALTAFSPWLVLSTTLLTENAAYPAFVWAVFLCNRAIARPTAKSDVAALAGLLLAFVARTQFIVLALVLPVALLCHELTFASSSSNSGSRSTRLRATARNAVATHRVLFSVYLLGGVVAAALAAHGSLGSLVGNYTLPFRGDLFPSGIWRSAAAHLDRIVIGCGVLPFVLAVSWALTTARRSERADASAFAWLLLLIVPLLTFEVTSFDLRFTPNAFIQDRYLFYLVPLFASGAGAALVQLRHAVARAIVAVAGAAIFAWLASFASYDDDTIIFWASPAAAFHPALVTAAGWLHLSARSLIRVAVILLALAAAALCLLPRSIRSAGALAAALVIVAFGVFEAAYVFERFAKPAITPASAIPYEAPRDWIDVALRGRGSASLVPSPVDPQPYWWDAEFWNKDVKRVLRVGGGPTFTPFPADDVSVDFAKGRLDGREPSDFLVVSPNDPRFHLVEAETHTADRTPLRLVRVVRPYRLAWATQGVTADGWTTPGQAGVLRVYGNGRRGRRAIAAILSAPREATRPVGFTLKSAGTIRRGSVDPGGARPPVRLDICVPARGYADVVLTTTGGARVPDGRVLALHFDRIAVRATEQHCQF
jgi:hypothetical protein